MLSCISSLPANVPSAADSVEQQPGERGPPTHAHLVGVRQVGDQFQLAVSDIARGVAGEGGVEQAAEAGHAVFGQLQHEIVDVDVKQALESLPEHFRMPVLLADVEGFSYKEIAEILDIPIGTVMSRLHRGRKALQKKLWSVAEERGLTGQAS